MRGPRTVWLQRSRRLSAGLVVLTIALVVAMLTQAQPAHAAGYSWINQNSCTYSAGGPSITCTSGTGASISGYGISATYTGTVGAKLAITCSACSGGNQLGMFVLASSGTVYTLGPNSPTGPINASTTGGSSFEYWNSTGTSYGGNGGSATCSDTGYFEIIIGASTLTGECSANGTTWTSVGSAGYAGTITMAGVSEDLQGTPGAGGVTVGWSNATWDGGTGNGSTTTTTSTTSTTVATTTSTTAPATTTTTAPATTTTTTAPATTTTTAPAGPTQVEPAGFDGPSTALLVGLVALTCGVMCGTAWFGRKGV